ncbi:unnamed protein product [Chilo suppressalis]|uniref:YEATS domain-containing protein n=1 Tax=Chilo suppressalis TaxID=168631 RepID=A0ABN8B523_CHISP|nr:unnamed protein product [Chilo suppressalis]
MDHNDEYHDPDYQETTVVVKDEPLEFAEDEKINLIKSIIRREFSNELEIRENEVMLIEQRMSMSRRLLHSLRYALVSNYFNDQKLQLSNSQIEDDVAHTQLDPRARNQMTSLLRDGQRRLHPSVRKLLGKKTVDLDEIFLSRSLRNKTRKDYSAMVQKRNYTIAADATKTLRPDAKPEVKEETGTPEPETEPSSSKPKKVPRHLDPKVEKVVTIDDPTRNKMKHRYRFIIGNTSKYAPGASRADRSTHKWLLYVRGTASSPDISSTLTALVVRLHHSYAPHHTVRLCKPPFHISRRGWGEFPARLELHFPLPAVNRPATLDHTIKLDRNYTGLQTLGAETIVDVWLYSTPEMLEYEYFDPVPTPLAQSEDPPQEKQEQKEIKPKMEPIEYDSTGQTDNWLDFFSKDTTELDVDEMIIKPVKKEIVEEKSDIENLIDTNVIKKENDKNDTNQNEWAANDSSDAQLTNDKSLPLTPKKRIMKYIDSATGKIYYLEMDRTLDLSKVQEIVINNSKTAKISPIKSNGLKNFRKKKGGVSLLKPEVKCQLKNDSSSVKENPVVKDFSHIENDHCYLGHNWCFKTNNNEVTSDNRTGAASEVKSESVFHELCSSIGRFTCVRDAVYYLLKRIAIITDRATDEEYVSNFPFVVENEEKYWKMDFAKRRNIEWSRAKLINRMLLDHFNHPEHIWRTKQILIFSRLHGFNPVRPDPVEKQPENEDWSSWNDFEGSRRSESNIKEVYPNAADICSLSVFNGDEFLNTSYASIESLDSDEDVEVLCSDSPVKVKREVVLDCSDSELTMLPVDNEEDRLRFLYVERKCADIGVELRNEDIGNGYSYSAVHAILLSAMKSLAEEIIRSSRAVHLTRDLPQHTIPPVWVGGSRVSHTVGGEVHAALHADTRLRALTAHALASSDTHPPPPHRYHAI